MLSFSLSAMAALMGIQVLSSKEALAEAPPVGTQCHTISEVRDMMSSNGEILVLRGDRSLPQAFQQQANGAVIQSRGEFYFFNEASNIAYFVSSNRPLNQPASCYKIEMEIRDAHLLDGRNTAVDPNARLQHTNQPLAKKECDLLEAKDGLSPNAHTCDDNFNVYLDHLNKEGKVVLLVGNVYLRDDDGSELTPSRVTIIGNRAGLTDQSKPSPGEELATTVMGATRKEAHFNSLRYTDEAAQILEKRRQAK